MKNKIAMVLVSAMVAATLMAGCGSAATTEASTAATTEATTAASTEATTTAK